MRSKLSDLDFSFEEQKKDEAFRRFVKGQDPRRKRITGADPRKKAKPPWKVTREQGEPAWEIERDENGKATRLVETRPPENSRALGASPNSIFELRVIEECFIGGEFAEPGCTVRCSAATAHGLRGARRATVLQEIQPAKS